MAGALPSQPNKQWLAQFAVINASDLEAVRQTFYDFQLYLTAGQAQLLFFQNQIGQGITSALGAVVAGNKSFADTNMNLSGQLTSGQNFLMQSIEIFFEPGSSAAASTYVQHAITTFIAVPTQVLLAAPNDVDAIRQSGWLEFLVLSKTYLREAPIGRFPPKTQLDLDSAMATNSATTASIFALSAKFYGRPYYIQPWVTIPSTTNFNVALNWPGAVATPSGFNGRIGCVLDGILFRNTQ
jgi:hypothetical protein